MSNIPPFYLHNEAHDLNFSNMEPEEIKFNEQSFYSNSYKKLFRTTLFYRQHNIILISKYKHKCPLTYK